jgi:hypothetical protein
MFAQAHAGVLTWTGDTATDGLLWWRPTVNTDPGNSVALSGGGQLYLAEHFTVDQTGSYVFSVAATGPGTGDWGTGSKQSIVSFLYQDAFDPSNPLVDQIENGSCGVACADLGWTKTLTAGVDYFIVITGYCGTGVGATTADCLPLNSQRDAGPFTAALTGPGDITAAVPEPATLSLVALAAAGLGAARRRRA